MIGRIAGASLFLAWSVAAYAQPSFDCGKASTVIERTICATPDLAKADREMARIYGALADRLQGVAKDYLAKDQLGWLEHRAKGCTGETEAVTRCLRNRYQARIATLEAEGEGPYPFVGEQAVQRNGKVKAVRYEIDVSLPRFDGPTADFSAVNKSFADYAQAGIKAAIPTPDSADRESTWTYEQGYALYRPGPHAVSVETTSYLFTGGAHGSSAVTATLVDLRTGRRAMPGDVFVAGSPWLHTITDLARADLKRQFVERPGFEDALQPANFDKLMMDPDRYLFRKGELAVLFNQYDVAAYVMGRYTVTIPYARLGNLIRPDGPIGR